MQWLQYRRQELVLQCRISLLLSCFETLPMGIMQDITESLLNQTHISFRKCQGCWSSASRRLPSSHRMQSLQKFCNHGSGWQLQELSWLSVHDLTQDDIAWPYAPRKQRLSPQALTVTQLSKHHREHLIPASEMFHISVAIILANRVVEQSPVQKSG